MNLPGINEDNFILNASRTCLSENNIINLKSLSARDKINWEQFTLKAARHNLSSLIYYSITKNNLENIIPKNVYEILKNEYYKTALSNNLFIEELNKLTRIIDDKLILLKGADLIQNLYPNLAIRPMFDLDILAEKSIAEKLWIKLQQHGFKSKGIVNVFKSAVHGKYNNQQPVHLCGLYTEKYLLEIHWNLFIKENLFYLTKKAWDSAKSFKDNLYRLSNEMMMIYLCFHFYRHSKGSAKLRMLCDINELILKYNQTLDWNEIKHLSFNTELENIVKLTLSYTSLLLNTPVPEEFIHEKIIRKKNFTLDKLTIREKNEDVIVRFKSKLNSIYRLNEIVIFVYRTIVPVKEWIIYTYRIPPIERPWRGYLKYWKYLFTKYLLLRRVQVGN